MVGFGVGGALAVGSRVLSEEESSSKVTIERFPLEASLRLFLSVTGFF